MPPPPVPKRPAGPPRDETPPRKKPGLELPFDDEEPRPRTDVRARVQPQPVGRRPTRPAEGEDEGPTEPDQPSPVNVPPSFSPAHLAIERGPNAGESFSIPQGILFIGRASASNARIQHPSISRRHAQLTRNGERFFLRDLASQNGTYVNQVRIQKEVELFPGDEIVMGVAQLRLQAQDSGLRPRPPRRSRGGTSPTIIALAAAVLGFGLAATVMFAWFKLSRGPSYERLGTEPTREKPAQVQDAPGSAEPHAPAIPAGGR